MFGEWLHARMTERGLNQAELGKLVGVGQQQVSNWLRGQRPRADKIAPLAAALDVSTDDLLNQLGEGGQPPDDEDEKLRERLAALREAQRTMKELERDLRQQLRGR